MAEPIKFLAVDDTEENLVAIEALLRRDGLQVLTARSGLEALELLLVHDVALALLDVQMPGMDGFELAELMRGTERTKHVPIIFVTAGSRDPQRVFKGYETGAVDFLFKPIEPHVLRSKADVFFDLHRQRQALADALRLNELFVGILGHDLLNPLNTILTGTQVLERQLPDADERQLRVLRRMSSAGQRMAVMIDQLRDLTRARLAGGIGFQCATERVDVGALLHRTTEELHGSHPDRDVTVEVLGNCTTGGDEHRLLQLFSNLVANAIQHGIPGTPVQVTAEGTAHEIVVCVHNSGVIPEALLPTLFDPFRTRVSTTASKATGLGLGLFIAQQVAMAHGGTVSVESSEATGTTFTVRMARTGEPG
jgi:two-component system sensor histidine kinase/response regulator